MTRSKNMDATKIKTAAVVFREDLYPRIEHNQQRAQDYSEILESLPPIEVNQDGWLIDGKHRWIAHRLAEAEEIPAIITETLSPADFYRLACERNKSHGLSFTTKDRQSAARALIKIAPEMTRDEIAEAVGASRRSVYRWISDDEAEQRLADAIEFFTRLLELHVQCRTQDEISEAMGVPQQTVAEKLALLPESAKWHGSANGVDSKALVEVLSSKSAGFSDLDHLPIYNVWTFAKKTNATGHFGNTEQRIVDRLLWLYTKQWDTVYDPFAGGGSTLDVCSKRLRRCFLSDRKPKPGLEAKVRTLDVCAELPSLTWSDVSLTYLDPPYWRQAAGEYSNDPQDLANMPLDEFTNEMVGVVRRIGEKQRTGHIAMIIQPTQWRSDPKGAFSDHVFDIIAGVSKYKRFTVENRISCPYSTEQCTPQMVDWSKENKKPLVLSRELTIWKLS